MVIYSIRNRVNGKLYIGQTSQDPKKYFYSQKLRAITERDKKPKLYAAIRKYGFENFEFEVLMTCLSYEEMNIAEIAFIHALRTQDAGYNLADGGGGRLGLPAWNKGRKCPEVSVRMIGNTNGTAHKHRVMTFEHKQKIRMTMKARGVAPTLSACKKGGLVRRGSV